MTTSPDSQAVLDFWFAELAAKERFSGEAAVDQRIHERFTATHAAVAAGECADWRTTPAGALAEIIVLDQFSRNLFRGTVQAFAYDGMALVLAQVARTAQYDQQVTDAERLFFYLPYMHSESSMIHAEAAILFTELGDAEALEFEQIHKAIIDRFGRYPHRNRQLGRKSSPEELAYLADESQPFFNS